MKKLICIDCKLPIMSPNMKAKLCKCEFKSERPAKPRFLTVALEVHEFIKKKAESESNREWASRK